MRYQPKYSFKIISNTLYPKQNQNTIWSYEHQLEIKPYTLLATIHISSELKCDTLPEFVLLSWGADLLERFWKREDEAEEEDKEEDEEEGKECETMRSMGHRILPQGPATGHRAGAEFHHLPEKNKVWRSGREKLSGNGS